MKNDKTLVSIITPSYNQGEFIEDTLLSVKNQDYPNIKHIVVDGGSTDNTLEILRKYANEYNLKWISEPDEGQSDAVNKGFRMTKGEIIGWLNSDDVYFTRDVISYVVEEFERHPEVDVIYGDAIHIDEKGLILRVLKMSRWIWNRDRLLRGLPLAQSSVFFRRRVILNNKVDETLDYAMDFELWLRLIQNDYNFHYLNRILSGDRLHKMKKSFHSDLLTTEKMKVLEKYGQKINFNFHILHFIDTIYLAIMRRLLGCKDILAITNTNNLAFNAQLPIKFARIKNQLCLSKMLKGIISLIR